MSRTNSREFCSPSPTYTKRDPSGETATFDPTPVNSASSSGNAMQDFDGDLAVVLDVVGQIDVCHAAFAQVALDPVAVGQGGGEPGGDLGQGAKMARLWGVGEGFDESDVHAPPCVYTGPLKRPVPRS